MHLIHFEAVYAEAVACFTVRDWPLESKLRALWKDAHFALYKPS